ncbi:MAG: methylated-DNA--[protein]-cysteine S-methyltransferase [Coriobacteriia bacterium]|nr:methylated-DNA--[protein]-cysteine S-methyltransferase [Coriobacteriia bacterium]
MQEVFHRRFSTELGEIELAATTESLVGLEFVDKTATRPEPSPLSAVAQRESDPSCLPAASAILDLAEREIREYLKGTRRSFDLPLDLTSGTVFQQEVWRGLQDISYGETVSYRELAQIVGRPRAARAVGGANHHNPISIIVPCHRVIAADGSLGGYGGGLWRKKLLLNLELRHAQS